VDLIETSLVFAFLVLLLVLLIFIVFVIAEFFVLVVGFGRIVVIARIALGRACRGTVSRLERIVEVNVNSHAALLGTRFK
jgi:uncharacterized protein (UPF0333 family)